MKIRFLKEERKKSGKRLQLQKAILSSEAATPSVRRSAILIWMILVMSALQEVRW